MTDTTFIPLPQGAGYAIIVGLGAVFAFGMILTTYLLKRYNKEIITWVSPNAIEILGGSAFYRIPSRAIVVQYLTERTNSIHVWGRNPPNVLQFGSQI